MSLFSSSRAGRRAAMLAASGFAGIALFQVALAAGVPWGHSAWGGAHAELSTGQRIGSAVAVAVWAAAALIVLGRAGFWGAGRRRPATLFRRGTWFLVAVSVLGALLNFASQSRWKTSSSGPWRWCWRSCARSSRAAPPRPSTLYEPRHEGAR